MTTTTHTDILKIDPKSVKMSDGDFAKYKKDKTSLLMKLGRDIKKDTHPYQYKIDLINGQLGSKNFKRMENDLLEEKSNLMSEIGIIKEDLVKVTKAFEAITNIERQRKYSKIAKNVKRLKKSLI